MRKLKPTIHSNWFPYKMKSTKLTAQPHIDSSLLDRRIEAIPFFGKGHTLLETFVVTTQKIH